MRGLIIRLLDILCWFLLVVFVLVGIAVGYAGAPFSNMPGMDLSQGNQIVGAVGGGIVGLIIGILSVGMLFLLIDIRLQTKRMVRLLEGRR